MPLEGCSSSEDSDTSSDEATDDDSPKDTTAHGSDTKDPTQSVDIRTHSSRSIKILELSK